MTQTFTPNALIRHLYKENTELHRIEILQALQEDFFLKEEYQFLKRACQELPKVSFYPSSKSIQKVLDYSASCR